MNGISLVLPNNETHPQFGEALKAAAKEGVNVECYSCRVEADSIKIVSMVGDTERYLK